MSNYFFEVLRPGINTTFQDKGRFHMQHLGVAPGGCRVLKSFSIANALVENTSDEMIVAALLHDIGDELAPNNHAEFAAAVLRPYVSEKTAWIVEKHGIFKCTTMLII